MAEMLKAKKPEYIRKYDYIRYFYRPKDEWFYSTKDLEKYIHDLMMKNIINNQFYFDGIDDEDEVGSNDENEIDSYTAFKEFEADNEDLDQNDPKIYEGNLIDQKSKIYIENYFKEEFKNQGISDVDVIDFSNFKLSNDKQYTKTLNWIKSHKYSIMFQPTFIAKNKAIAKPDALIQNNGKLIIIETKGTTNPKINHLVDVYYQNQVLSESLKGENYYIDDYYLCLIKYELSKLRELSFVLTRNCSTSKSGFDTQGVKKLDLSFEEKIKVKAAIKEGISSSFSNKDCSIKSLLGNEQSLKPRSAKIYDEFYEQYLASDDKFWSIIDELYNFAPSGKYPSLEPNICYKSKVKNNDYWLALRDYYYFLYDTKGVNKFPALQFSGNFIHYKDAIDYCNNQGILNKTDDEFIKWMVDVATADKESVEKRMMKYLKGVCYHSSIYNCSYEETSVLFFNKLKPKKVYFDFESLNIATRAVNNYPPFMQVVNQVSIIFDHGDKNLKLVPYIVVDPINGISKDDFKMIIDSIMPDKHLNKCREYSYVVYNKSFEQTRLKEMAQYINEPIYNQKVEIIISNIYDLADLFNIKSTENIAVIFKELKGFYSIKKILPLVEKYDLKSFKDTGCKNYKTELEQITNGGEAQSASTKRFFGLLNDKEWAITKENLGKYCDNDVRAMIAVEYFLRNIFAGKIKF